MLREWGGGGGKNRASGDKYAITLFFDVGGKKKLASSWTQGAIWPLYLSIESDHIKFDSNRSRKDFHI